MRGPVSRPIGLASRNVTGAFILGVDLDGVCADYTAGLRRVVADDRGIEPSDLPLERSWGFEEWGLDAAEFERLHRKAVNEDRILATLPVIEGCADALWRLSDAGIWIRIITHRLYTNWSHQSAVADTVSWLDENSIPYRDLCFLGAKPQVEADMYIDDAPHNVSALRGAGNDVICFSQPYNSDIGGLRADNWVEAEEIILDAAAKHAVIQPQFPGIDAGADRLARNRGESTD